MGMPRKRERIAKCGRPKCRWHRGLDKQPEGIQQRIYDKVFSVILQNSYDFEDIAILWELEYYGD